MCSCQTLPSPQELKKKCLLSTWNAFVINGPTERKIEIERQRDRQAIKRIAAHKNKDLHATTTPDGRWVCVCKVTGYDTDQA